MRSGTLAATLVATLFLPTTSRAGQAPAAPAQTKAAAVELKPTNHQRLPADASQYWLAPTTTDLRTAKSAQAAQFADAVKLEVDGNFAKALPIFSQNAMQSGPLGDYARYYQGLAELRLGRPADARKTFQALAARTPIGYLIEGAQMREAECDEALADLDAALAVYTRLAATKTSAPDDVLMWIGRTARALGDNERAADAYSRVLYEFSFNDTATAAATELETLPLAPMTYGSARYKLELGRGERIFGAKRYAAARPIFDALRRVASGDDRELVDLRLAECEYFLKRPRIARDGVKPYIDKASRRGEALYFYAVSTRELGDTVDYSRTVRRIVNEFPEQSWAEEALNNLATHDILQSDDEQADATFREMYRKFPTGRYAERAGWKVGWWAYRNQRYADAFAAFESAAASFPRSDYRPAWLYWSGRAHDALKERGQAEARYTLVATDYLNSYYGRLAVTHLVEHGLRAPERKLIAEPTSPAASEETNLTLPALPANEMTVRALLSLSLYDQAADELRYAQKVWGDSSAIQATFGWIANQRGDLRAGINAMKRAYPQYLAAGGEQVPVALQRVLFPVNYWSLIKQYSVQRQLDPYTIAALIAQESTFTPDVKSAANAYGLMQLLPSVGRQYARMLQMNRRFSLTMLTTAEPNIKMGTAYFADLVRQFGGVHYALATYNAGPSRVARWISERPGIERDEFIDDIPFPETQNYVKKILGTAEDYRRLYGPGSSGAGDDDAAADVVRTSNVSLPSRVSTVSAAPAKAASAKAATVKSTASTKTTAKPKPSTKSKSRARAHKKSKTSKT